MQRMLVKIAAFAVALGAAGCANTDTTKMIEDNQKVARDASDLANQALKTAAEASRKADAAMSAARAAQQCCDDTKEGMNRSFEKSMRK